MSKNVDPDYWLHALEYVALVMNHTAVESLGWKIPIATLTGTTPDISALLQFEFWEEVYFTKYEHNFPGESKELKGRFLGIAPNKGHALTYKVLTNNSHIVLT